MAEAGGSPIQWKSGLPDVVPDTMEKRAARYNGKTRLTPGRSRQAAPFRQEEENAGNGSEVT